MKKYIKSSYDSIYSSKKLFEYPEVNISDVNQKYLRYIPKTLQPYVIWLDVYKYGRETNIQLIFEFDGVQYLANVGFDSISEMKFFVSDVLKDYRSGALEQEIYDAISEGKSKIVYDI